jgi:hypothetical protein
MTRPVFSNYILFPWHTYSSQGTTFHSHDTPFLHTTSSYFHMTHPSFTLHSPFCPWHPIYSHDFSHPFFHETRFIPMHPFSLQDNPSSHRKPLRFHDWPFYEWRLPPFTCNHGTPLFFHMTPSLCSQGVLASLSPVCWGVVGTKVQLWEPADDMVGGGGGEGGGEGLSPKLCVNYISCYCTTTYTQRGSERRIVNVVFVLPILWVSSFMWNNN